MIFRIFMILMIFTISQARMRDGPSAGFLLPRLFNLQRHGARFFSGDVSE